MRVIKLDANGWKVPLDFYEALLAALEAPHWHGRGIGALIDSMIYGSINGIEPPDRIWITGSAGIPADIKAEVDLAVHCINEQQGVEKEIEFQIDP